MKRPQTAHPAFTSESRGMEKSNLREIVTESSKMLQTAKEFLKDIHSPFGETPRQKPGAQYDTADFHADKVIRGLQESNKRQRPQTACLQRKAYNRHQEPITTLKVYGPVKSVEDIPGINASAIFPDKNKNLSPD